MNYINTSIGKLFLAFLISVGLSTTIFAEEFPHSTADQAKRMEDAIRDNVDGVLILEANKTYLFSRTVTIRKKIKIIGGEGTILKLDETSYTGSFIRCEANEIAFENLTLDASNKVNKAIVDINDMIGVSFEGVHLKNALHSNSSKGDAIGAYNGRACHGLKVNNCIFTNITHMAIKIINRDTDKYRLNGPNRHQFTNGEIRKLLAPVIITNSTFNEGIDKVIEADCGNDDFVIDDENDPRWVIEDREGGRRYTYTTNLAGSIIKRNTFKTHKAWLLGLIQASNIKLLGNKIAGPANTTQSNNAIVHMEQVVQNVTIAWNTMNLNSGVGNPMFISSTAREGRQRLREENPRIIAVRGRGGFTGNSGGNSVRGSDWCAPGSDPLTCKREIHSYGPRNIYIFGNKFRSTAKIRHVISFKDGENIKIGLTKNNTVRKNSYSGIDESLISHSKIRIGRGDLGNCGIIINEAELSKQNPKDFNIDIDAAMDDDSDCIQIIESDTSAKDVLTLALNTSKTFSIFPNPATSYINISAPSEKDYSVYIYNLSGTMVKQLSGNATASLNVSDLSSGIYIVEYKDATTVKNKRLIIQ